MSDTPADELKQRLRQIADARVAARQLREKYDADAANLKLVKKELEEAEAYLSGVIDETTLPLFATN